VIRANLLPRRKEVVRLLGVDVDRDHVREALVGLCLIALVVALGTGIEELRLHRLEDALTARETLLTEQAPERALAKRVALDVARYQEIAREAQTFRRSGPEAAIAIARIGNTVPPAVWLESIERDADGYTLAGASRSVDALSGTVLSLDGALPRTSAALLSIDNHAADRDSVHFRARLGTFDSAARPGLTP
jgi:Tfp pilus assembly protein PilN